MLSGITGDKSFPRNSGTDSGNNHPYELDILHLAVDTYTSEALAHAWLIEPVKSIYFYIPT